MTRPGFVLAWVLVAAAVAGATMPTEAATHTKAAAGSESTASSNGHYFHRTWRRSDGLPGISVYAIAQTADGYLWVGTENGLARFDGLHFTVYGERPKGVFRSQDVEALATGRDGNLWIGTERGLLRMRGGELTRDGAPGGPLDGAAVSALAEDAGGDLWVGTRAGLLRRSATTGKVTGVWLPRIRVIKLLAGEAGEVWIGTEEHGAWRLRAGKLAHLGGNPLLDKGWVTGLMNDRDGSVLVFTPSGSGRFLPGQDVRTAPAMPPRIQNVAAAAVADGSLLLVTTDHGIIRVTASNGQREDMESSLAGALVRTIFVAADHTIWFGGGGTGLHRLAAKACQTYTLRDGLVNDITTSVLVEPGGAVWVGANGGLAHLVRGLGSGMIGGSVGHELSDHFIGSLLRDSRGTLWAGTSRGLARRLDGRWVFLPPWGGPDTLVVNMLLEDSAGNLWVGTAGGLGVMSKDRWRVLPLPGLEDREISGLAENAGGGLWIGTRGAGLLRLQGGKLLTLRSAEEEPLVSSVRRGVSDDMWVGTWGHGLLHYRNGRWYRFHPGNGLADNTVRSFHIDRREDVWMCTSAGISRLRREAIAEVEAGRASTLNALSYGPEDGVPETTCYGGVYPNVAASRDGHVWFSTIQGLVELRPERLMPPAARPEPQLDGATVDGREQPTALMRRLAFKSSTKRVELRFSAPVFTAQGRFAMRYRLAGFESSWMLDGNERKARYTSLPPGSYRFEVSLRDESGTWSAPVALADLEVQPLFYQRKAFAALVALALLGALRGGHWLAERRLRRRADVLEAQVQQRTEELREANLRLEALATTDALTGLANRRVLQEGLEREIRRAARSQKELALVMIDVDYFKRYNDSLGHLAGDDCLRYVASALRTAAVRVTDLVARYGGEEFAILLPETSAAQAVRIAEAVRQVIEKLALAHPSSPVGPCVTISAGVAGMTPDAGFAPADLIAAADQALYGAKQRGRNQALLSESHVRNTPELVRSPAA